LFNVAIAWCARNSKKIRKCLDTEISAIRVDLGLTEGRWEPWMTELLGIHSDKKVAKLIGKSKSTVARQRKLLEIDAFAVWTPGQIALLGTATDKEVGQSLGKSTETVKKKRQSLGIDRVGP